MQIDMHYYGTYAMARAAGLKATAVRIIATAAQYVDDNTGDGVLVLRDGARIPHQATAHHVALREMDEMLDQDNQRQVWVPFHFLPGNQGTDYTERLVCQPDSVVARAMLDEAILRAKAKDICMLERIGLTAHVYADTFSHWGFSGVSSRRNKVEGDSFAFQGLSPELELHLSSKGKAFFARFGDQGGLLANLKSFVGERGALGHGAVATYPDIPYLDWSYTYEFPGLGRPRRDNPAWFMAACAALYAVFERLAVARPDLTDRPARGFDAIKPAIRDILALRKGKDERSEAWQDAAKGGSLFGAPEAIPAYDPEEWVERLALLNEKADSAQALAEPACRFHLAAARHRSWILHELLPDQGLVVA
jgi:hypothetical protein